MGLPQFHPPPGHIRSKSMASANFRRLEACDGTRSCGAARRTRSAKAVGSTQLAVPAVQLQPQRASFWLETFLLEVKPRRKRNHVPASPGFSAASQFSPCANASRFSFAEEKAQHASEVTQAPWPCPGAAGQEPSINCESAR